MHVIQTVLPIYLLFASVSLALDRSPENEPDRGLIAERVLRLIDRDLEPDEAKQTQDVVSGSYMFLFNRRTANEPEAKKNVYISVQRFLDNVNAIEQEFAFGRTAGFFVSHVSEEMLEKLNLQLSDFGRFIADRDDSSEFQAPVEQSTTPPIRVVSGSYMFLFHSGLANDPEKKTYVYKRVQSILSKKKAPDQEFAFGKTAGFFIFNVSDQNLAELKSTLCDFGRFVADRVYPLDYSSTDSLDENDMSFFSTMPTPCGHRRRRAVLASDNSNKNLDYLDRILDGAYIPPVDDCRKIDVYVLEAGVNSHPDFDGRLKACYNYPSGKSTSCTLNNNGYGTHVAGIIGSRTFGVTSNVNLYSIKVISEAQTTLSTLTWGYTVVQNLLEKSNRAVVYLTFPYSGRDQEIETLTSEFIMNYQNKLVFITAAAIQNLPACNNSLTSLSFVVSVGSTDSNLIEDEKSNYGNCIGILAPAKDVRSLHNPSINGGTLIRTSPSNAGALVAGVIAQYWVQRPELKGYDIRNSINSAQSPLFDSNAIVTHQGTPDKLIIYEHC